MNAKNNILLKDYYNLLREFMRGVGDWETTSEIAKKFNSRFEYRQASWNTVFKYLKRLHSEGSVEMRFMGGSRVWRGVKEKELR